MNEKQKDLLTLARMTMLRQMPYYGTYAVGMGWDETEAIPTACTDGERIQVNSFWLMGGDTKEVKGNKITRPLRPMKQVIFIGAHEVLHNTFKHGLRRGYRDPRLWNVACDFAINQILVDGHVGEYPEPWPEEKEHYERLQQDRFRNMSAEEIYDILEKERQKQGGGDRFKSGGIVIDLSKPDQGGCGGFELPVNVDGSELTDAQRSELERAIDSATSQAAAAAKSQGKLPAELERLIHTALKPKIDWRERLRMFVAKVMPSDYSWARPHRRYLGALDLYLPYVEKRGVGQIAFSFDTSGSMDYNSPESEGAQGFSECKAIYQDTSPEKLHIFYVDAAVHGHEIYEPGDDPELSRVRPKGGGGTDFRPLFDHIEKEGIVLQCMVFFTDGYATFPDKAPPYPVLWVSTTNAPFPWGEVIKIEQ